jgi:hypothetical protein
MKRKYPKPRTCLVDELIRLDNRVAEIPCGVRWYLITLDHTTKYNSKVIPPIDYEKILGRMRDFLALSRFQKWKFRRDKSC